MIEDFPFKSEKEGHIAWLTLNRPEKRNSMNYNFFDGLTHHFEEYHRDPDVRVVIIKGEGKSFTVGLDLFEMGSMVEGEGIDFREKLRTKVIQFQESISSIEKCSKPVIAAVHGHCIGGGVNLLSACDIRIASTNAIFSIRETRIAIIADIGVLQRLPYIIGHGWCRELALTGRDFTAEEALRMGFITHLYDNKETLYKGAGELAQEISDLPPLTVQGVKDVSVYSRDNGVYPGLQYVAQKSVSTLPSQDLLEAFNAFLEKRAPHFRGK